MLHNLNVGGKGWVGFARLGAISQHHSDLQLLPTKSSSGGCCVVDRASLVQEHRRGDANATIPVHKSRSPSCAN